MSSFQQFFGSTKYRGTDAVAANASTDTAQEIGFVTPESLSNFALLSAVVNIIWQFLQGLDDSLKSDWCALAIALVIGVTMFIANKQTEAGKTTPTALQLLIAVINSFLLAAIAVGIQSNIPTN